MLSNDLKKGDNVVMKGSGWKATILDNKKGNIRLVKVYGAYTEIGSVYVWDIEGVELTPNQEKEMKRIKAAGF